MPHKKNPENYCHYQRSPQFLVATLSPDIKKLKKKSKIAQYPPYSIAILKASRYPGSYTSHMNLQFFPPCLHSSGSPQTPTDQSKPPYPFCPYIFENALGMKGWPKFLQTEES